MYAFYQRLFPWRQLFQWLNHSPVPTHDFAHREFAFTLQNDAYLRYQSFPTFETLRRDVLRLNPSRFEIGPVYSANPRDRKSLAKAAFRPLAKELVFDIDLTDYDDVRTCCDKANICLRCWQFVTVAIRILDAALRDDLGFRHVLWVYSGRRGAHAWVCDKRARALDDQKRRSAAAYLEVVRGGDKAGKRVSLRRPLHMHLARSLDVLKESFAQTVLRDQDPWRLPDKAERLLELLPESTLPFVYPTSPPTSLSLAPTPFPLSTRPHHLPFTRPHLPIPPVHGLASPPFTRLPTRHGKLTGQKMGSAGNRAPQKMANRAGSVVHREMERHRQRGLAGQDQVAQHTAAARREAGHRVRVPVPAARRRGVQAPQPPAQIAVRRAPGHRPRLRAHRPRAR